MAKLKTDTIKPDVLQRLIAICRDHLRREDLPGLTNEQAQAIEDEVRAMLGGQRVRIPKRGKHPTEDQRVRIIRAALETDSSDEDLTQRFGISRSTLYRYIKRGTEG